MKKFFDLKGGKPVSSLGPSINWDYSTQTLRINKSDGTSFTLNVNDCFIVETGPGSPFIAKVKEIYFSIIATENPDGICYQEWRPTTHRWNHRIFVFPINANFIDSINRCPCPQRHIHDADDMVLPGQIMIPSLAETVLRQNDDARPAAVDRPGVVARLVPEIVPEKIEDKIELLKRFECKVCMVNIINTRLDPCGHTLCSTCYDRLPLPKKCPTCRIVTTKNQNLFFKKYLKK